MSFPSVSAAQFSHFSARLCTLPRYSRYPRNSCAKRIERNVSRDVRGFFFQLQLTKSRKKQNFLQKTLPNSLSKHLVIDRPLLRGKYVEKNYKKKDTRYFIISTTRLNQTQKQRTCSKGINEKTKKKNFVLFVKWKSEGEFK